MKKNKYLVFAAIGFELVSLILAAIWGGNKLVSMGYSNLWPTFLILGAFLVWFISLMLKLKNLNKND